MNRLSDNMSMYEGESEDEIVVFKRPLALVSSAASTKVFPQDHNQKSAKRKSSHTRYPKIEKAISSGKAKRVRQVNLGAMAEAKRIQLSLRSAYPSFVKGLVRSNVEGSYTVVAGKLLSENKMILVEKKMIPSLPVHFSSSHLPMEETMITLEDENDKKFQVKYLPKWFGLSGGWKKFAVAHKLSESDVLLFHLVEPNKFKITIIRAHDDDDVISSISNLDEQGGSKPSDDPTDPSEDLGTFEEFQRKIHGGSSVESALDENTLKKYYKLCSCKNVILHDKTFSDRNSKLKAGVISEVVSIADAVKTCSIFTPREDFKEWENSLKSFELLGMKVEFLVNRVSQLMKLGDEYEGTRFEDELKKLEAKRVKMKESFKKICNDIGKMKSKAVGHKVKFQQVIDSPW